MDGLYEMMVKTPMGELRGNLKLITNGNNLSGYLETMGKKHEFSGGSVNGNRCTLSGSINASITTIKYNIQGELNGNILYLNAQTNMGNFNLQGRKIR